MRVKIADKRMHKETDKAYVYTTSGYGGSFFTIPKSQIKEMTDGHIRINEVTKYPATIYVLTDFISNKLEESFNKMSEGHLQIM